MEPKQYGIQHLSIGGCSLEDVVIPGDPIDPEIPLVAEDFDNTLAGEIPFDHLIT